MNKLHNIVKSKWWRETINYYPIQTNNIQSWKYNLFEMYQNIQCKEFHKGKRLLYKGNTYKPANLRLE